VSGGDSGDRSGLRERAARTLAALASAALLAAVLSPIAQNWSRAPRDGFPLSHYPMFSKARSPVYRLTYVVGFDAHGGKRPLPHQLVAPGGMNQVRKQIARFLSGEEGGARALCRAVVERIERLRPPGLPRLTRVSVVTGSYRLDDYFAGERAPLRERTRASCPGPRTQLRGASPGGS
jgi:hypothetical protein